MDIAAFLKSLEETGLAARIRESLFLFPLLESIHVIGLALVLGTIAIIDLRLLGIASTERPFRRMASDILKWTWAAFAMTVLTGSLMFITNAQVYYGNSYFRVKMILLGLTAVNMGAFELTEGRRSRRWENDKTGPPLGRVVAVVSLILWVGVVFTGRFIGFTTSRATVEEQAPVEIDFDDLFGTPTDK